MYMISFHSARDLCWRLRMLSYAVRQLEYCVELAAAPWARGGRSVVKEPGGGEDIMSGTEGPAHHPHHRAHYYPLLHCRNHYEKTPVVAPKKLPPGPV